MMTVGIKMKPRADLKPSQSSSCTRPKIFRSFSAFFSTSLACFLFCFPFLSIRLVFFHYTIKTRDLSFKKLEGNIPNFDALDHLEMMYLTGNLLTGLIPEWIKNKDTKQFIED